MWNSAQLERWRGALEQGDVAVAPAEGMYGYCADPFNEGALRKLIRVKGRPVEKGFIVLISSYGQLKQLTHVLSEVEREAVYACWPGNTTLLFIANKNLPQELTGGQKTVAVRMPNRGYMKEYLGYWGKPLVSSSLNRSGQKPAVRAEDIPPGLPALTVDEPMNGRPSRIFYPEQGRWIR